MKKILVLLVAVMTISGIGALAEDKVGYIDMNKIFEAYYKTARENYNLELRNQNFKEQLDILDKELQNSIKEYQQVSEDVDNDLLAESAREDAKRKAVMLEERIRQKQNEGQKAYQEGMRELERLQADTMTRLVSELIDFITRYAADNGYTHVYEVSGKTLNRVPVLLVYPKDQDFTEAVITALNAGHENELKESKESIEKLRANDNK